MWRFKANRAYHCIWVIAKHPDLKQLLGFAIAQLVAAQIISTSIRTFEMPRYVAR